MFLVRENLILVRKIGTTAVDEIDTGQVVFFGNLLGAQVFLDGHRIVGAAFDRRVVADDHALVALNPADARNDPGAGGCVVIHVVGRGRRQFKEGRARIQQTCHPVARQHFPSADMPIPRLGAAALRCRFGGRADGFQGRKMTIAVLAKIL